MLSNLAATAFVSLAASPVITAIQEASTQLTGDATKVIGAAVTIGAVFFGAKLLWGKFKSIAGK